MRVIHIALAGLAVAFAAGGAGCAPTTHYSDPSVKSLAGEEKALLVVPFVGDVLVAKVDGKKVPHDPMTVFAKERRYWVRPGIHTFEVYYDHNNYRSVHNAEATFALEPGHRYEMHGWPPKVKDTTTGEPVEARLRAADQ